MGDEDIISLDPILPFFVKDISGISSFQWLAFKKTCLLTLFHRTSVVTETPCIIQKDIAVIQKNFTANKILELIL